MWHKVFLHLCFCVVAVWLKAVNNQNLPTEKKNVVSAEPQQQLVVNANKQFLVMNPACNADIKKYCELVLARTTDPNSFDDIAALNCLQDGAYHEDTQLEGPCGQAIWQFKAYLTQDPRFTQEIVQNCPKEVQTIPGIKSCTQEMQPGYALSCMMEHAHELMQNTTCFNFLMAKARVAFSDFRLVAPFVQYCGEIITKLGCGSVAKPSDDRRAVLPHSQGSTVQCFTEKLTRGGENDAERAILKSITPDCHHQLFRIAELQYKDFHLNRPLYFACRNDRDRFCSQVPSGEYKVFQCLIEHKESRDMEPECAKRIAEYEGMMGLNYRLAHPLMEGCSNEMTAYQCKPNVGFEQAPQFHLSWVLFCLERGLHYYEQQKAEKGKDKEKLAGLHAYSDQCQHEMYRHRQMMMSEYRMSPEIVLSCARDISLYCSPDLQNEGKTLHCLMRLVQEHGDKMSAQCRSDIQTLFKVANIGSNYKVDKILYASCRPLIEGKCKMDLASEVQTFNCLKENIDEPDMTDECKQRLMEVYYFIARDWTLDPELYNACHKEAVIRCSALDDWNLQPGKDVAQVDPGPLVLSCLYRSGYDEQNPLSAQCASNVRRVLRERASRVNLLPEIEEACRSALSQYCSGNSRPNEEMDCLQQQFEKSEFKQQYPSCYKHIFSFTEMESKDTKLNRLLFRACHSVIQTYCDEVSREDIDHGEVMQCLSEHKNVKEMTNKCLFHVQHFELVSLRDYHFSYKFTQACQSDIQRYCTSFGQDKGAVIRCLSDIMFEHRVLGESKDLKSDCKKQLRVAYLQQEQVHFDDRAHMGDVEPELTNNCKGDLQRLKCMERDTFKDVVECLRFDYDNLEPSCKAIVFEREKIEAMDNMFDDKLQNSCNHDIARFCPNQPGDKVLYCLTDQEIVHRLQKDCQKVVKKRMLERVKDDRLNPGLLVACRADAELHCSDEYRKINDARYAKQQLGGIITSCLRAKFAQFNNGIHLSPECKDEVSKVILETEIFINTDLKLYKACQTVINRHCSNTILQQGSNFGNVLECLKADLYTGKIQDASCVKELARHTQESLVDIHLDPSLYKACSIDIQRFCRDTPSGQSRIIMCLIDAMQVQQIRMSTSCRVKLNDRHKLWSIAHDQYKMLLPESWSELYNTVAVHPERSSIITYAGLVVLALLLLGCLLGRLSKNQYSELKNR